MNGKWQLFGLGAIAAAGGLVAAGICYISSQNKGTSNRNTAAVCANGIYENGQADESCSSVDAGHYGRVLGKSHDLQNPEASYLLDLNKEDPPLKKLREFSLASLPNGYLVTPVEEGKLLTILCRAIGARKVIDIGVFTGCSAYALALGLPADGKVIACDVNLEDAMRGQPYWEEGGVASKIDLRIKPALETLQELLNNGEEGSYDMVFIDADKLNYSKYYEYAMKLLHNGGLVVVDNALGLGPPNDVYVYDTQCTREDIREIRRLNSVMMEDKRLEFAIIPVANGLGIGYKN